jgi:hypothetical protein
VDDEDDDDDDAIDASIIDKKSITQIPDPKTILPGEQGQKGSQSGLKSLAEGTNNALQGAIVLGSGNSAGVKNNSSQQELSVGNKEQDMSPSKPSASTNTNMSSDKMTSNSSSTTKKDPLQRVATHPKWIGPTEDEVPVPPGVKGPKKRLTQIPKHNAGLDEQ